MPRRNVHVVRLRHRREAANPGDAMGEKVGPKQIDQALAQKILKGSRIGDRAPETQRDNGFFGDFANRLQIGNRTRFVEPKRMHALHRRGEARRISRRKLSTRLKGEVRVGAEARIALRRAAATRTKSLP